MDICYTDIQVGPLLNEWVEWLLNICDIYLISINNLPLGELIYIYNNNNNNNNNNSYNLNNPN